MSYTSFALRSSAAERRESVWRLTVMLMVLLMTAPASAQSSAARSEADPDAEVVPAPVRVLRESPDFRLRVQAAFALGASRDLNVRSYVERALLDAHPSVRSSAAAALARLGAVESLGALQQLVQLERSPFVRAEAQEAIRALDVIAERQSRAEVEGASGSVGRSIPWQRIRMVLLLSAVRSGARLRGAGVDAALTRELVRLFTSAPDVAVMAAGRPLDPLAAAQIRRRRISPLRVDVRITRLSAVRRGAVLRVDCAISIVFQDAVGGAVRSVLQGRATSEATRVPSDEAAQRLRLAERAATGAVESALADIEHIFASLTSPS